MPDEASPMTVDAVYSAARYLAVKLRVLVEFLAGKTVPIPPWGQRQVSVMTAMNETTMLIISAVATSHRSSLRRVAMRRSVWVRNGSTAMLLVLMLTANAPDGEIHPDEAHPAIRQLSGQ
jgi:hypothetical protein